MVHVTVLTCKSQNKSKNGLSKLGGLCLTGLPNDILGFTLYVKQSILNSGRVLLW